MKFSKMIGGVLLPLAMAGCADLPGTTYQLEELQATTPSGTPFAQALAREYLAFALAEKSNYSWFNSQHFAKKGLAAAHGEVVAPERLSDWDIADKAALANLVTARSRLDALLNSNAPSRVPALTATAQVKFDCWVDQQEKGWNQPAISACRDDFMAAADAIESQVKALPAMPPAAPAQAGPAGHAAMAHAGKAQQFQFFFDFGKASLTDDADATLRDLAAAVRAAGYPRLEIAGYTDAVGSDTVNQRLSLRRAQAVQRALVAQGVPADRISVTGLGKAQPMVATADGVKEPQNRRVVVHFAE